MEPLRGVLLTDLYQLTMLQGYLDHGMTRTAVFELFVRKPPESLAAIRARTAAELEQLPSHLRRLGTDPPYPVQVAAALKALAREVDERLEMVNR